MNDQERNRRRANVLVKRIAARLPTPTRVRFVSAVETRNEDEAWRAIDAAPADCIPHIAVCYYLLGFPPETLRAVFTYAIRGAHVQLRRAAYDQGDCFLPFLRAASFEIPCHIPTSLTVWRGTYGVSKETASAGDWWTDNRDIAIFYATQGPRPLVLRRLIPRSAILFATQTYCGLNLFAKEYSADLAYDSALSGFEFIFDLPPGGFIKIDGFEDEWSVRGDRLRDDIAWSLKRGQEAASD